jgi:hypothetical protein
MRHVFAATDDEHTLQHLRELLAFHEAKLLSETPECQLYTINAETLAVFPGPPLEIEGEQEIVQAVSTALEGRLLVHAAAASLRDIFKGFGPPSTNPG